jgi:flagellar hook-associated protein 2
MAAAHTVHSDATVMTADDLLGSGDFTVTVDGTDHVATLDGSQSITDLADVINGWGAGVSASVVNVDTDEYKLVITADETGEDAAFTVDSQVTGFDIFNTAVSGTNASIEVGSGPTKLTIERQSNSMTGVLAGVTIELHAIASDVTIATARDFEGSGDGVASVVTKLNSLLSELAKLTSYDAASGTAGILAGDSTARSLMASLRSAVSGSVGSGPSPYVAPSIGISITRTGSFSFDQEKLEELLAADFDGVTAFFNDVLLDNLDSAVDDSEGVNGSIARARDRWQNQIDFVDDRIAALEDRLDVKEAALIRQFSALDVALQTLNSQSAWLSSQIAGFNSRS